MAKELVKGLMVTVMDTYAPAVVEEGTKVAVVLPRADTVIAGKYPLED
jgi:hypothetical protein